MDNFVFSKRIKQLRAEKNLSLREVGEGMDLSPAILHYYETGQKKPSFQTIMKLAKFYNVSVDYLLGMDYVEENRSELYLKEETLLKMIRRSPIITNFIFKDPRTNINIIEEFITKLEKDK